MPTNEEWRRLLGDGNLTDEEVDQFVRSLRKFLDQFLDQYFRDEFVPDEL